MYNNVQVFIKSNNNKMAHVCIGDSTVKVIYYKHTINVYHVSCVYVWIQECGNYIKSIIIIIYYYIILFAVKPIGISVLIIFKHSNRIHFVCILEYR